MGQLKPSNLPENSPQVQSKECDRLKTLLAEAKGKIHVPGKSAGDLFLERFSDLQLGEQKGHFEHLVGYFFVEILLGYLLWRYM